MARKRVEQRSYIPPFVRERVLKNCNGVCAHCGIKLTIGENFTVEHVIPLNKGGNNDENNYVALCESCNKGKSDDIVEPKDWYPYLPKARLTEVQKLFEDYCKNTDWLGYDTVFRTDQFNLTSLIPVFKNGSYVNVPATYRVERMRKGEFLEYSMVYRSRLSPEDKDLLPYTEDELYLPYYRVMYKGSILLVIAPYIAKAQTRNDGQQNVLFMDIFANPDLKRKRSTVPMLYNILQALRLEIQNTLSRSDFVSLICYSIRVPNSDELGSAVLRELDILLKEQHLLRKEYDYPNETGGCTLIFESFMMQGSYKNMKSTIETFGTDKELGKEVGVSLKTLQSSIDMRLRQAKELAEKPTPEKPKKKDKKASKKKKHR